MSDSDQGYEIRSGCSGVRDCRTDAIPGEKFCPECKPLEVGVKGRNPEFLPPKTERHRWNL